MDPVNQDQQPITPPEPQAAPPVPQPMPITPVEPVALPVQTIPPAPQPQYPTTNTTMGGAAPVQPGGKKSKTGLIIGLVAGGIGLIVVIIIAIVVAVSMFSVSKADYSEAFDQYSKVRSANSDMALSMISLSSIGNDTDVSFKNNVDKVRAELSKLKEETAKLGKLKAMQTGEGKKVYENLNSKVGAYVVYVDGFVTSVEKLRPAEIVCSDTGSLKEAKDIKVALVKCIAELDKASNVPNSDTKSYIASLKKSYEGLVVIYDGLSIISDPYGSEYTAYSALRNQTYKINDNVRDSLKDYRSNLEKHASEVDIKDTLSDTGNFLADKVMKG